MIAHSLRPDRPGMLLGIGWLLVWFGAIPMAAWRISALRDAGRAVPILLWVFAALLPVIGVFVLLHLIGMWRGWREVVFHAGGITVREKRWRLTERVFPRARVAKLRGTFPGWTETLLFDFDGKPIGLDLPWAPGERERLLQHALVRWSVK